SRSRLRQKSFQNKAKIKNSRYPSKPFKKDKKTDFLENIVNPNGASLTDHTPVDHIGLEKILKTLSPELMKLIDLMYFQGYTQSEISEELEMPLGTVKTRLRKAISELRKQIVQEI
ncbi:MAG: sigma-70 family RNA polymerase sigma factor, partial [Luteibaculum sp.]